MFPSKTLRFGALSVTALALSACSTAGTSTLAQPSSSIGDGHGYIAGAEEVPEPPLHLLTLDSDGAVNQMDLIDESWTGIGRLSGITGTWTDGRFVFASNADTGTVSIIDSGRWTRDHEDHFHYYRGSPRIVGTVKGDGAATIASGGSSTGIYFKGSGEGVLIDNEALADGTVVESVRIDGAPQAGAIVQLASSVLMTIGEGSDRPSAVRVHDSAGVPMGSVAPCRDAGPPITTSVGVAFPCADGALLATDVADDIRFERIPYPEGTSASPAAEFSAREGRPTVAGLAGDRAIWLLDTRNRSWTLLAAESPLRQVIAVDDADGHVIALTMDGRVTVLSAGTGATLASTDALLPKTMTDPHLLASVGLVADQQRAYLNAPAEQLLYEIDFADSARVARTFSTDGVPQFLAGTGR